MASQSLVAVVLVTSLFAAQPAVAADDDKDDTSLADKAAARLPQSVVVGSLIHRSILEPVESQPIIGTVQRIVRASDGTVKVVVAFGGLLGFGRRPIAVPVEAMALLGEYMEIVEFTPEELNHFPTFNDAGSTLLPPTETIKVGLAKPSH